MKCTDLQSKLPLYTDRFIGDDEQIMVEGHLKECPLCRQRLAEIREVQNGLRRMPRTEVPAAFKNSLKRVVVSELRSGRNSAIPVSRQMREWLTMGVMPYGVGVVASMLVAFTFISMMYSGLGGAGSLSASMRKNALSDSPLLAANKDPLRESATPDLSQSDYAFSRSDVGGESPSVNPQGALIALTKSLIRGRMKDDEVVVVADVFGDGLAQIAEVVEPSRDRRAVTELQKALDSDPAYAPFVPATLDKRSDSVRVVLRFQSVDVSTNQKRRRH